MILVNKQRVAEHLAKPNIEGSGPVHSGRFYVYDDATGKELKTGDTLRGNASVGTGRNLTDRGISDSERAFMLSNDIADAVTFLAGYPWFEKCPPAIQDVLVCLAFNLGHAGFAEFHDAIAALAEGDYPKAADAFGNSKAATEEPGRMGLYELILRQNKWPVS